MIAHVTIVDVAGGRTIPDRTVTIAGRRIASVGDAAAIARQGALVVDGRGKYLMPGLWDMHVHLDSADLPALVALGITGARDMGGDLEELLAWRRRIIAGGPTIGSFRIFAPKQFPAIFAGFKDLMPQLQAHHIDLLAGTDLGDAGIVPGVSLHDELALLVDAGLTPAEALRSATLNPARFLGLTDSLGTIEPGKIADLVLLAADPLADIRNTRAIVTVIRAGKVQPGRP